MRQLDHERHADGLIIEKHPVGILAVRPERFAVIGHDGNQRTVKEPAHFQLAEQVPHD